MVKSIGPKKSLLKGPDNGQTWVLYDPVRVGFRMSAFRGFHPRLLMLLPFQGKGQPIGGTRLQYGSRIALQTLAHKHQLSLLTQVQSNAADWQSTSGDARIRVEKFHAKA